MNLRAHLPLVRRGLACAAAFVLAMQAAVAEPPANEIAQIARDSSSGSARRLEAVDHDRRRDARLAGHEARSRREQMAPTVAKHSGVLAEVGFGSESQLFVAGPSTRTQLDGDAMRWSIDYQGREGARADRELGVQVPAVARRMRISHKSDRPGPVFVRMEERDGEVWFVTLDPRCDWTEVDIDLAGIRVDPAQRRDGVLQPDRLTKLTLADTGAHDREARGLRQVWLRRWVFE